MLLDQCQKFVFDLDGTLYRTKVPLERQIIPAIWRVASEILQTSEKDAAAVVRKYNDEYEYCVFGFQKHHNVAAGEFIERVYAYVDRSSIEPDQRLNSSVRRLARRSELFVLTNSGLSHSRDVLRRLEIADCFVQVISIEQTEFQLKPHRRAYQILTERVNLDGNSAAYFDDSVRNVQSAWRCGFKTVLVSNGVAAPPLFYEMHIGIEHKPPTYVDAYTFSLSEFLEKELAEL